MSDKNGIISVRPPKDSDLKERLLALSAKLDRSMNYVAIKAMEEYLKKEKKHKS